MAVQLLVLFVVATVLTQGQAITYITLPDQSHEFLTNPYIGKTLTIPKSFEDTLEYCRVIFPNGWPYEAFPNNQLPPGPISFMKAAQPFTSCSIGFVNAPVSASGTYELVSRVRHSADNSVSQTTQRFHLKLFESDSWQTEMLKADKVQN